MAITPKDYISETPPPRIIGTECEYNVQVPPNSSVDATSFVGPSALQSANVTQHGNYLGEAYGAGKAYPDVGNVEFDTRESRGPASIAVEDIAGIDRMLAIIQRSAFTHSGIYRVAGTYIPNGHDEDGVITSLGRTSGYHESYLVGRETSEHPLTDTLLPTFLATRLWGMSGTLRDSGFVWSQKVWGAGGRPVERSLHRRTTHGNKPMITIPKIYEDNNTIGENAWARLEVRVADPGQSIVNRLASFAGFSLATRLVEHCDYIGVEKLYDLCLTNPIADAKRYAKDMSLQATCETVGGKTVTAVDAQESLLELFEGPLQQRVSLPEDEKLAIGVIRQIIDALRQSHPEKLEYSKVLRMRTEIAAKHQFVANTGSSEVINAYNKLATLRGLSWDRVAPTGNGKKFWQHMHNRDPLVAQIYALANKNGVTERSKLRAAIIDNPNDTREVIDWAHVRLANKAIQSLGSPAGD